MANGTMQRIIAQDYFACGLLTGKLLHLLIWPLTSWMERILSLRSHPTLSRIQTLVPGLVSCLGCSELLWTCCRWECESRKVSHGNNVALLLSPRPKDLTIYEMIDGVDSRHHLVPFWSTKYLLLDFYWSSSTTSRIERSRGWHGFLCPTFHSPPIPHFWQSRIPWNLELRFSDIPRMDKKIHFPPTLNHEFSHLHDRMSTSHTFSVVDMNGASSECGSAMMTTLLRPIKRCPAAYFRVTCQN